MSLDARNQPFDVVSGRWGAVRLTTSSNVAVATAVDANVKMIYIQGALANASAVRLNVNAAASAAIGIEIPQAAGSAVDGGWMELPVPSVTCIQIYAAEDGDIADMLWRA